MINVSDAFKQKLQDGKKVWQEVEITFPDGTVKTVKNEIMGENCTFSDCAESSSFPIGCVVCKSMTLELDNTSDQWKNYNFYMAKVHAYLKMQTSVASPAATDELLDENHEPILDQSSGTILATKAATEDRIETIDKGIYTITTPEQYGEILSFTALDDMYKTNATYISHLVLPQSIETLVRDACETLGIPSEVSMTHGNLIVSEIPENMTFRQLFGWAAMFETANARLDSRGYLRFIRWDFSNIQEDYNAVVDADGNVVFKGGANIDSESFISPTGNWIIDNDGFLTLIESATDTSENLKDFFESPTVSSDDIVITGIKLKNRENEAMYGSTGYVLELENDLVADSDLNTVAAQIGDSIIGAKFRNMSGELAYNPLIEFGDMAYTYDRKWNRYITPLTDVSCSVNGKTAVKTQADDPIRGMSKFVSDGIKAIVEARRLVKIEKTEREKAVERLAGMLASSGGLYMTEEPQEDGSTIYYMHNKPTLEESDIIWKLTAEAFAVSVDGGKTYPYGFAVTGELITRLLYAEGINADYINAGTFVVRDKNGKVIFMADMETGSVKIDASYVQIGGSALDKALDDMQGQIDGNIETWTGKDEPTLDNYPAKNWLTDEEKSKHVGDVYYDSKNQGYRFRNDGQGYGWQMVKDTDITKALQDAVEAKESAANAEKAAALARNMTLQLSNDMQTITSDADGNIPTFPTVATAATVMYGTQDITDDCSFTITKSTSVTGSWNDVTHVYNVTGLNSDNGWVDIKATYLINLSVTKRFTLAKQKQGLEGDKGLPGKSPTIRYASMPDGSDMSDNPKYVKLLDSVGNVISDSTGDTIYTSGEAIYVGFLKADAEVDSTNPSDYEWSRYKGTDGLTQYTHLAYANSADGKTDFSVDDPNREYIGMYVDFAEEDSTNPEDYAWSLIKGANGAQGVPGTPGKDGKTPYLHIAYANSADGKTDFSVDNSVDKQYIGQYTDYTEEDSTNPADYSWTKIKGEQGNPGRTYFIELSCSTLKRNPDDLSVTPSSVTAYAYYRDGNGEKIAYAGRWRIQYSLDGNSWTNMGSAAEVKSVAKVFYSTDKFNFVQFVLYRSGGYTEVLDTQSISVLTDVSELTQEQIVKILSANGAWKGLYYDNGHLYISFDAALGGTLTLGGKNNGNGKLSILDADGNEVGHIDNTGVNFTTGTFSGELKAASGTFKGDITGASGTFSGKLSSKSGSLAGWTIKDDCIESADGGIKIRSDGHIQIGNVVLNQASDLKSLQVKYGMQVHTRRGVGEFTDGSGEFKLIGIGSTSANYNNLCIASNIVSKVSSSSKRYKNHVRDMSIEEAEKLLDVPVVWFKYKDGYLMPGDRFEGKPLPGFYAEDVYDAFSEGAMLNEDGQVEDWNYRTMIPAMMKLIQNQQETINNLTERIEKLEKEI